MDRLSAKLVNRFTAKLVNRLTAKLVDHLTAKLVVVNLVKLHLTKFIPRFCYRAEDRTKTTYAFASQPQFSISREITVKSLSSASSNLALTYCTKCGV